MGELCRLRDDFQYFHTVRDLTIGNVRTKHQPKVLYIVYLAEHPEPQNHQHWAARETIGLRTTEITTRNATEVSVPIDDNNVYGYRRRDGGEYGFEEISRGGLGGDNRFRCDLECSEVFDPRQIEMIERDAVSICKSLS